MFLLVVAGEGWGRAGINRCSWQSIRDQSMYTKRLGTLIHHKIGRPDRLVPVDYKFVVV